MSKAFTKDDDDAGFVPPSGALAGIPAGPFRITTTGAALAACHSDPRIRAALARAEILAPVVLPERAAVGVRVVVTTDAGIRKEYRLVGADERALVGEGCSVEGPIGRALLGAQVGDVREVLLPRGNEELEVIALEGEG